MLVLAAPPTIDREGTIEKVELRFRVVAGGILRRPNSPGVEIRPGRKGSWPQSLTRVEGRVFFAANDHAHGRELWVTDGTPEGTHLVRDLLPPADLSPLHR